jgi:NADP-dependent 3-hydroxy acid dehydrogenase YdfG
MAVDKVVLVTGASSGIGADIARELAAAGAKVVLGARRIERLEALTAELDEAGGTAFAHPLDVTDRDSMNAFADAARDLWGRVDVIVNNAGIMPLSLMASMKVEEWDRMIDVNIKGVLYGIAAVLPEMTARGSGHIINIASIGALSVAPTAAVYLHSPRCCGKRPCTYDHRPHRSRSDENLSRHSAEARCNLTGRAFRD